MKISVSFDNLNYTEVFYGGLRNDIEPETFNLKTKINGELIISKFIKIEPLAAWGMNFNYSIWFVSLWGISEVKGILRDQKEKSKVNQVKDCLKTLKSLGYTQEYESLSLKLGEDNPVLSKIKNLIEKEDFEGVEEYVLGLEPKYYENFIKENGYVAKWEEISKKNNGRDKGGDNKGGNGRNKNRNGAINHKPNINSNWPCERGGHQMVTLDDKIYLYGGWNGLEELGDFWVYEGEEWKCILPDIH
ncbi:Muskelin [Nosema bombycis CQ1]|uniref:Muskelin n=1 Tax=Nosema bombycis (strain CQ1 / CVCC 102059) TaxID=578461 RepID=R0KZ94_NOSB1|nr:Muskelin [Nosema bombycis CQ1]|eukprot:EOB15527.1 Muskelin [Nosema bombycis CQ1]